MGPQSTEGTILLITLAAVCVIIFATTFYLTFIRKADTRDNAH
ncbi:hypothetical protein [Pedobacter boryungensis]|nr:hypothetical protein [Pedobacter boryungensis]